MPSTAIPDHFQTDFFDNWKFLVSQEESRLSSLVETYMVDGKELAIPQIGTVDLDSVSSRFAATVLGDVTMPKRWLKLEAYAKALGIDEFDEVGLGGLSSPESVYLRRLVQAYNRKKDSLIISAATGNAITGATGSTTTTLPATQKVAVDYVASGSATNSGLTLAKILRAKKIMDADEVPMDDRVIVISSQQLFDLLNGVDETKNSDYVQIKSLVQGEVNFFAGFQFVNTQLLSLNSSTDVRTCFAFHKEGMALGIGKDMSATIDRLPSLNNAIQVRVSASMAAARVEEDRVVEILCDESP